MGFTLAPVTILRVETRPQGWRITTSDGGRYVTRNAYLASLCQRAVDLQRPVRLLSAAGWYYRELTAVQWMAPATVEGASA